MTWVSGLLYKAPLQLLLQVHYTVLELRKATAHPFCSEIDVRLKPLVFDFLESLDSSVYFVPSFLIKFQLLIGNSHRRRNHEHDQQPKDPESRASSNPFTPQGRLCESCSYCHNITRLLKWLYGSVSYMPSVHEAVASVIRIQNDRNPSGTAELSAY